MFDKEYWKSTRQPTSQQLENLCRNGLKGGPCFVQWFRKHVNSLELGVFLLLSCIG